MKKYLIIISVVLLCMTVDVYANPYKKTQTIDGVKSVPCTYVAWQQAHDKMGVSLPSWGNAVNWYKKAKSAGYSVGATPKANSIAVFSGGCCGHVAYVTKVNGDMMDVIQGGYYVTDYDENGYAKYDDKGNIIYKAYNGDGICYDCTAYTAIGSESGGRFLTGFIYLDDAPKNPPTTTKKTTTTTKKATTTSTTKAKSNDNTLKSLIISSGSLDFNKDITEYTINVTNDIDSITIDAVANDDGAKITGTGNQKLVVGENIVSLLVTAEDGSTKTYTINITREESVTTTITTTTNPILDNEKVINNNKNIYLVIGIVFIIIVICALIFLLVHKKKT